MFRDRQGRKEIVARVEALEGRQLLSTTEIFINLEGGHALPKGAVPKPAAWIQVASYVENVSREGGKEVFSSFSISKAVDGVKLKTHDLAPGKLLPEVDVEVLTRQGRSAVVELDYTFKGVRVAAYQISDGGDRPTESATFDFQSVTVHTKVKPSTTGTMWK